MKRLLVSFLIVLSSTWAVAAPVQAQQATASASTSAIVVANLNDGGTGSLRQAIADASPSQTITFDPSLSGTITLTQPLTISKDLTIVGPTSRNVVLSGGDQTPVIRVDGNFHFSITNMVIQDGAGPIGGLANYGGNVIIFHSIFQKNHNGAILNAKATMTIDATSFIQNAESASFVVENIAANVVISGSDFEDNKTGILGNYSGNAVVRSSVAKNNGRLSLAAIENSESSSLEIVNSTFQGNIGVLSSGGSAILTNDTLANNNVMNTPTIDSGSLKTTLINTIIVSDPGKAGCRGAVVDGGGNIEFPVSDCGSGVLIADPKLAPLADNGGPTLTMALLPGSPAIGHANSAACNKAEVGGVDQRGLVRPASCDTGAFQTGAIPAVATASPTTAPTAVATTSVSQ